MYYLTACSCPSDRLKRSAPAKKGRGPSKADQTHLTICSQRPTDTAESTSILIRYVLLEELCSI